MEAKDRGKKELLNYAPPPPALRILNNSADRFFKIFDVHATLMRRTSEKTIGTFKQCSAFKYRAALDREILSFCSFVFGHACLESTRRCTQSRLEDRLDL
jgi:hypothetical protein